MDGCVVRFNLSAYYDSGSRDFICSQPDDNGMTKCSELPGYTDATTGRPCNGSVYDPPSADDCVNWNQFYSSCRAVGHNPFQGAISFDNIGLAWVAIFQVNARFHCLIDHCYSYNGKNSRC